METLSGYILPLLQKLTSEKLIKHVAKNKQKSITNFMQSIAIKPHIRPYYYNADEKLTTAKSDDSDNNNNNDESQGNIEANDTSDKLALGQYYQTENGVYTILLPDNIADPHTYISTDIILDSPFGGKPQDTDIESVNTYCYSLFKNNCKNAITVYNYLQTLKPSQVEAYYKDDEKYKHYHEFLNSENRTEVQAIAEQF